MTLQLLGSLSLSGTTVTGGGQADTAGDARSSREFVDLVDVLARSPEALPGVSEGGQMGPNIPPMPNPDLKNMFLFGEAEDEGSSEGESESQVPDGTREVRPLVGNIESPKTLTPASILVLESIVALVSAPPILSALAAEGGGDSASDIQKSENTTDLALNRAHARKLELQSSIPSQGEREDRIIPPSDRVFPEGDRLDVHPTATQIVRNSLEPAEILQKLQPRDLEIADPTPHVPSMRLHVAELTTHFPAILSQSLFARGFDPSTELRDSDPETAPKSMETRTPIQDQSERARLLRFHLEPAHLGSVLVKMRVSDSRVEIAIETQSAVTGDLLSNARDALCAAIEHNGMTLDVFNVATQHGQNGPRAHTGENDLSGSDGGMSRRDGSGSGAFNEDGGRQRQRKYTISEDLARESAPRGPVGLPVGILL